MLAERRYAYEERERPWTVPALLGLSAITWLVSAVFDLSWEREGSTDGLAYTLMGLLMAVVFARGLWLGRRWAYVLTVFFGGLALLSSVPYLFSDRVVLPDALWLIASSLVHFSLLFHPLTRTFFKEHPLIEADEEEPNQASVR